jgi:hypothetical protein
MARWLSAVERTFFLNLAFWEPDLLPCLPRQDAETTRARTRAPGDRAMATRGGACPASFALASPLSLRTEQCTRVCKTPPRRRPRPPLIVASSTSRREAPAPHGGTETHVAAAAPAVPAPSPAHPGAAGSSSGPDDPATSARPRPQQSSRRGARSVIGRRALRDIAVVRGRAERAAESLRIRVQAVLSGIFAHGSAVLLGRAEGGWAPLGVFAWQNVSGAESMDDDDVDRTRALQKVNRRRDVLDALRRSTAGALSSVVFTFTRVASVVEAAFRGVAGERRMSAPRRKLSAGEDGAPQRRQRRGPAFHARPGGRPQSTAKPAPGSSAKPPVEAGAVVVAAASPPPPPRKWEPRALRTAAAGALALGVGAAVSGGALTALLTASAALVAATAVVSSAERTVAGSAPKFLLPGFRRSAVARRIDRSILDAAKASAPRAQRRAAPGRREGQPAGAPAEGPDLVVTPAATGTTGGPIELDYCELPVHERDGCEIVGYHSVDDSAAAPAPLPIQAGDVAVDDLANTDGVESVIDTDMFEVLPSVPAIFSVPLFGAVLHFLDELAFGVEQVLGRVARRAVAAGVPRHLGLFHGARDGSEWKLLRVLQARSRDGGE